jgi:hypothetical protein
MSQSKQRRQHAPSWLVFAALAVALPLGLYGQGGQGRGGRGGGAGAGRGAAPAAGAPAVPGAPPPGAAGAAAAPAGQGRGGPAAGGGAGGRGQAPVDVTGYWVSLVDEDYIERMFPDSPRSGVPRGGGGGGGGAGAGAGGRGGGGRGGAQPGGAAGAADSCRVYGAGGSMRLPGRLHITWQDDNTLKVEMDSGTQTRLLHFGGTPPPASEKSLQGYSAATWEIGGGGRGGGRGGGGGAAPASRWGSLNVVTTNLTGGYLLTSRSSYTENATLTEYFQRHSEFGNDYMTVVAVIADPGGNHTTSSTFKKEPDGSKFSPSGCTVVR